MVKKRADVLLVEQNIAENRSKAQALIMSGIVLANDTPVRKAGDMLPITATLRLKGEQCPWVSRGGYKLHHALVHFSLSPQHKTAIDVGASTGGFTDVLLSLGAQKVYAVDVGHNQLAWKLREDSRVVVMEKVNARHLTAQHIPEKVDWVVCDASFISLKKVLPAALALTKPEAVLVALIKPQFEAGREHIGKGGVVRDSAIHEAVCADIVTWLNTVPSWQVIDVVISPILGPEGNKEFLVYAKKGEEI